MTGGTEKIEIRTRRGKRSQEVHHSYPRRSQSMQYGQHVNQKGTTTMFSVHREKVTAKDIDKSSDQQERKIKKPLLIWYPTHKEKGIIQKLKDSWACTKKEKVTLYEAMEKERSTKDKTARHVQQELQRPHASTLPSTCFTVIFTGKEEEVVCQIVEPM